MRNPIQPTWSVLTSRCFAVCCALLLAVDSFGAVFTVTSANNSGAGTLRQAIVSANGDANHDTIAFNIPGGGLKTITLTTALPTINHPVTIDGATQPGYMWANPLIQITGPSSVADFFGLEFNAPSNIIKGLRINYFARGIVVTNGYNRMEANFIGIDETGTMPKGNGYGIELRDSPNNVVGGTNAGAGNVISGNYYGITIGGKKATNNIIQGNLIGLGPMGENGVGNHGGILVSILIYDPPPPGYVPFGARGTIIGGLGNARNVISGNSFNGIEFSFGASDNVVLGNTIGLTKSGNSLLPNGNFGIGIYDSTNNQVGSALPGAGNVIAASGSNGVYIGKGSSTGASWSNRVQGNFIGSTLLKRGNGAYGVHVNGGAYNMIGGFEPNEGNRIAYNGSNLMQRGHGVVIQSGTNNAILGNSIWANAGRGIDLGKDSFDVNDLGDGDEGPNRRQNYPVVTAVKFDATSQTSEITWTLNSPTNSDIIGYEFRVEFFSNSEADPSGFGEGQRYLGYTNIFLIYGDSEQFTRRFPITDRFISVTATELQGNNTSEFSPTDTDGDAIADAWEGPSGGIDFNEDGIIDLLLIDANPLHKDVFVEIDSMAARYPDVGNLNRARTGITDLTQGAYPTGGFNNAPAELVQNPDGKDGINVHLELDDTDLDFAIWADEKWVNLQSVKATRFGTATQRSNPQALAAKRLVYHYCIFGDQTVNDEVAGRGEIGGNDLYVLLKDVSTSPTDEFVPTAFMHELGHNLGLRHGGVDDINDKPNYHSIMNYGWARRSWYNPNFVLDFSREDRSTLDESALDEHFGLGGSPLHATHVFPVGPRKVNGITLERSLVPEVLGGVDWNTNGMIDATSFPRDISYVTTNDVPGLNSLVSSNDWSRLQFYFLETPSYADTFESSENANDLPKAVLADLVSIGSGAGVFEFTLRNYTCSETGGLAVVSVRRVFESAGTVSVSVLTSNGTALVGLDYAATSNLVTFNSSETIHTFTVPIINDTSAEHAETIQVRLVNPTGGSQLGPLSQATITILDDDPPIQYTVINTANSGAGSLRQAILDANSTTGLALIDFNIPTNGGLTISPITALPTITDFVTIDGTTQPGFSNAPIIELNGASSGFIDGLRVAAGNSTIRGLIINRFNLNGINILTNGRNHIEGCYIGLDRTGTLDQGNAQNGISVSTSNNVIGGTSLSARNYISGNNQSGILLIDSTNQILGNVIGLGVTNAAVGNTFVGINSPSSGHTIGGTAAGARNVISGNASEGILLNGHRVSILGNFIGTDLSGQLARPNARSGMRIQVGNANLIGGTAEGAGNVISGNSRYGIELTSASTNVIYGNRMGTDVSGTKSVRNLFGGLVALGGSRANRIGDVTSRAGNTIGFNNGPGVFISSDGAENNVVRGNMIFSNSGSGIDLGLGSVTLNDTNDTDTGANQLQNFPVLTRASNFAGGTVIHGTLNSQPNTNYTVDFYANLAPDNIGWGEGQFWLGSASVTTDTNGDASFSTPLPAPIVRGRYFSATATDAAGNTSEFSKNIFIESVSAGRTFTVINTDDSGFGSLRQAILDANVYTAERNTIAFNIPGAGVQTIYPESQLPVIEGPVLIDGYSQPGSSPNTASNGHNGVLLIELDGALAGTSLGLHLAGGNSIVRGLVINNFINSASTDGVGAIVVRGQGGSRIEGNFIGTVASGMARRGTLMAGVHLIHSSSNVVGGPTLAARNVISGVDVLPTGGGGYFVSGDAVALNKLVSQPENPSGNRIEGNLLGPAADGITPLGNQGSAVRFLQPNSFTTIGGTAPGAGNVIAFNGSASYPAISCGVDDPLNFGVTGTAVLGNRIHSNVGLGIKGNLLNSPEGPGNFPFLDSAISSSNVTTIHGRLHSSSNALHRIEFFANDVMEHLGHGEGKWFLGWTNTITDSNGLAIFTAMLPTAVSNGYFVCATATDAQNNTSEFSPRVRVGDVLTNVLVVNTTDDVDDGVADATHTSLREALLAANNHLGPDAIHFAIGSGARTIFSTANAMPAVMDTVTLDATTQPGFAGQPLIYLDGLLLAPVGFRLYAPSNTIRGFAMNRFGQSIYGDGRFSSPFGGFNIIEGNYLGTDRFGSPSSGGYQNWGITLAWNCSSNRIGGTTLAARNLISGNVNAGISIQLGSDGNTILGNLIGTDLTGSNRLDNGRGASPTGGIYVQGSKGTVIGGSTPGSRNVISANHPHNIRLSDAAPTFVQGNHIGPDLTGSRVLGGSSYGIYAESFTVIKDNVIAGFGTGLHLVGSSNRVEGNFIGTDVSGTQAIGNQETGIHISGGNGTVLGGTNPGLRNVISGNYDGVSLGCCGNFVQGNFIGTQADGVSPLGNRHDGVILLV